MVDVGCGQGGLASWLTRQGATVLGVDGSIDAVRAARMRGVVAVAADACALPLDDAVMHVALIFNSLHHFPDPLAALAEARRVVGSDGVVFVAEPLASGPYFSFMQPVDDETAVRAAALRALDAASTVRLDVAATQDYAYDVLVADLDDEIARWTAVDRSRRARARELRATLAKGLERHGVATEKGYALAQPMRCWLLRARN